MPSANDSASFLGTDIGRATSHHSDVHDGPAKSTSRWLSLRGVLFNALYEIAQDQHVAPRRAVLMALFDCVSVSALLLSPQQNLPWSKAPLMTAVHTVLLPASLIPGIGRTISGPYSVPGLFVAAASIALLMMLLFLWTLLVHARLIAYRPVWRVKLLRGLIIGSTHGAFIPLITSLLSPWRCIVGAYWADTGIQRYNRPIVQCLSDVPHVVAFVAAVLLVLPFVGCLFVAAATLVDRAPDPTGKRNIMCASHGRATVIALLAKCVMAMVYVFAGWGNGMNGWFYVVVMMVCINAAGSAHFWMLPYYHAWVNHLWIGCYSIEVAMCVATMLALGVGDTDSQAGAYLALFMLPCFAYSGFVTSAMRWKSFAKAGDIRTPYGAELRARYLLQQAYESDAQNGMSRSLLSQSEAPDPSSEPIAVNVGNVSRPRAKGVTGLASRGGIMSIAPVDAHDHDGSTGSGPNAQRRLSWSNASVLAVDAIMAHAETAFASSPIMDVFIAQFLGQVKMNRHLERRHLRAAEAKADTSAIDIHFFVFQRLKSVDDEDSARSMVRMTVIKRIEFEKLLDVSRDQVMSCRRLQAAFWTALSEKNPDLSRVAKIGARITRWISLTHDTFRKLLTLAPQSGAAMREYAAFLEDVANDPRFAQELLNDAELADDEQARERAAANKDLELVFGHAVPDFDLSGETAAILRVSAQPGNLGAILEGNSAALKLWGYNKREMVGRDINVIVPEPIASIHPILLERFTHDGREVIVNTSRVYFSVHRAGFIFPCKLNVRPNGDDWVAVAEEITTSLAFVWFTQDNSGKWRVTAACRRAATTMGLDLSNIRTGGALITEFIPNIGEIIAMLSGNEDGGLITMQLPSDVMNEDGDAEDGGGSVALGDETAGDASAAGSNTYAGSVPHQRPLVEHIMHAKLQSVMISCVRSPVHILRWRPANVVEMARRSAQGQGAAVVAETAAVLAPASRSAANLASADLPQGHPCTVTGNVSMCPVMRSTPRPLPTAGGRAMSTSVTDPNVVRSESVSSRMLRQHSHSSSAAKLAFVPTAAAQLNDGSNDEGNVTGRVAATVPSTAPGSMLSVSTNPALQDRVDTADLLVGQHDTAELDWTTTHGDNAGPPLPGTVLTVVDDSSARADGASVNDGSSDANPNPLLSPSPLSTSKARQGVTFTTMSARYLPSPSPIKSALRVTVAAPGPLVSPAANRHASSGIHSDAPDVTDNAPPSVVNFKDAVEHAVIAGRAESVHSKGSKGSKGSSKMTGSTATSVTDALRSGVRRRSSQLERSLVTLQRAVAVMFICICLMNIVSLIIVRLLFADLERNLALVANNGDRAHEFQSSIAAVQELTLRQTAGMHIVDGVAGARARLQHHLHGFDLLHQDLYRAADGTSAEELDLYTNASILVYDLVPGSFLNMSSYAANRRYINLANAGLEFISKAHQVWDLNDTDLSLGNANVFWILQNGYTSVRQALNTSTMLSDARSERNSTVINMASLTILCVAIVLLAVVALCIISPAVNHVMREKHETFEVILEVPLNIVRAMRNVSMNKALAARAGDDGEHSDQEDRALSPSPLDDITHSVVDVDGVGRARGRTDTMDERDDADAALKSAINTLANRVGREMASAHAQELEDSDSDSELCSRRRCCQMSSSKRSAYLSTRDSSRHYRHAGDSRWVLLASLLWPLLIFVAYYAGTYEWLKGVTLQSDTIRAETLYSKQMEVYVPQVLYNTRAALTSCESDLVRANIMEGRRAVNFVRVLKDALLYGHPGYNLRAGLHVSPATFALFVQSGCVEDDDGRYTLDECRAAMGGLVARGLSAALDEYFQRVQALWDSREAALASGTCTLDTFSTGVSRQASELGDSFLLSGVVHASQIRYMEGVAALAAFVVADTIVTVLSVLVLAVFWMAVYRPLVRALDRDLKGVRSLLLLFPDDVSRVVPAIAFQGRRLASEVAGMKELTQ